MFIRISVYLVFAYIGLFVFFSSFCSQFRFVYLQNIALSHVYMCIIMFMAVGK